VGGFSGNAEPELFTRWVQLGALLPFFRVHTALNTAPQEPWAFGQPYEDIARQYITLRYQLLPYVYAAFAESAQYGWPIIRPLFTVDPADEQLRGIEDAFMFGDSLLVAPILKRHQVEREVYLPRGIWFDYHTGQCYEGGKTIVAPAPLDTLPLFARAGHVIPQWPVQQYVGQAPVAELRLKIYYGDGEIALYEDAGEGMEYLSGVYRWLYFTCKRLPDGGLTVSWRQAGNYQPSYERVRCEVYGITFEPVEVRINDSAAPLWYFEKGVVEFTADKSFENVHIVAPDSLINRDTLLRSPLKD
jgi:alpha-glucosidase